MKRSLLFFLSSGGYVGGSHRGWVTLAFPKMSQFPKLLGIVTDQKYCLSKTYLMILENVTDFFNNRSRSDDQKYCLSAKIFDVEILEIVTIFFYNRSRFSQNFRDFFVRSEICHRKKFKKSSNNFKTHINASNISKDELSTPGGWDRSISMKRYPILAKVRHESVTCQVNYVALPKMCCTSAPQRWLWTKRHELPSILRTINTQSWVVNTITI